MLVLTQLWCKSNFSFKISIFIVLSSSLTSTAASVASASVPSAALVLMLLVLSAIDAPVQDVSLLWAVDWFVDRCRTTNNMLGDAYGAAVVAAMSRKELMAMDEVKEEKKTLMKEDVGATEQV